jgi:tetratricopeptide (TPR) repeat protein
MRWYLIFVLTTGMIAQTVFAAKMTFKETYVYDAGETDSKLSCRAVSLLEVKRLLIERLGTYILSETKVENSRLTKDQITSISAAIVKTEILEEKWDGSTYTMTARIVADPQEVARQMETLRQDPGAAAEIKKLEEINAEARDQMSELKANLSRMQTDLLSINHDFAGSKKLIDAWGAFERGMEMRMQGRYEESLAAFDTAIAAHPGDIVYFQRGKTLVKLENYRQAVDDFAKAITLNPQMRSAYFYRGKCLLRLGEKSSAINDMRRAEKLGSDQAKNWLNSHGRRY